MNLILTIFVAKVIMVYGADLNATLNVMAPISAQSTDIKEPKLKCVESYCLPANYDSLQVPFNEKGMVEVSVDFDTLQILEVDDIKFTVSFSMYFGIRWNDERIKGPPIEDETYYQPIDTGFIKNLWVPDIYLWYLKSIDVLDFLIPFAGYFQRTKF